MLVWGLFFFFFLLRVNDSKSVLNLMTSECSKFCLDVNLDHLKVMETTSVIVLKQFSGKLTLYEVPHEKKKLELRVGKNLSSLRTAGSLLLISATSVKPVSHGW